MKLPMPMPSLEGTSELGAPRDLRDAPFTVPHSSSFSTMGIFSKLVKTSIAGSVASVGVFWGATRNDLFQPMDTSDPIFQSALFNKFNPNRNPTLHDVCVRQMPLDKIQPSLVEEKGKLVEAFCAGVWGGLGKL